MSAASFSFASTTATNHTIHDITHGTDTKGECSECYLDLLSSYLRCGRTSDLRQEKELMVYNASTHSISTLSHCCCQSISTSYQVFQVPVAILDYSSLFIYSDLSPPLKHPQHCEDAFSTCPSHHTSLVPCLCFAFGGACSLPSVQTLSHSRRRFATV